MSEQQLAQVFKLFTQADSSISRRFGGSGLGLSLSNQLAKLMAGNITATSQVRRGSQFCFILPCQHQNNILTEPSVSNITVTGAKIPERFSGLILLAEDHHDNRRLIARLLENLGLNVLSAKNGIEAVELCIKYQPELILLDIQMPDMDGVDAFKKLRSLGYQQPIYALTANAMSHEISQYLALGFTGHLKKTIEMKSFIATIAKHYENDLSRKRVREKTVVTNNDEGLVNTEETLRQVDLSDLISEFKSNLTQDKQALIFYNEKRDYITLGKAAHRLSGAAQMFGFAELNQAAKELDLAIKVYQQENKIDNQQKNTEKNLHHINIFNDLTCCLVDEIYLVETTK